jgi:L-Ala-D/L-Glu epimerase
MRFLSGSDLNIVGMRAWPVDIPLTDTFTISRGSITSAENVFVEVRLKCGAAGYGESAPFTSITGENREETLRAIRRLEDTVIGQSAGAIRRLSHSMAEIAPSDPAARCGLETAVLDAFCRALGIPASLYFGGASTGPFETDITLPMVGREKCLTMADFWHQRGFRVLKTKVGSNVDSDITVIRDIWARFPDTSFVVDANQGFTEQEALVLMRALKKSGVAIQMIEQPVPKVDLEALARLRRENLFPICADESVGSRHEAAAVVRAGAADIINIKIMKCGVVEAFDIALFTLTAGLRIMFGGMMETRLAMGCSLAMAAGLGRSPSLDLDTPLLMSEDPWEGGYRYEGPRMILGTEPGLGTTPRSVPSWNSIAGPPGRT